MNTKINSRRRSGTATVELAVCLPLLATIVFGCMQACNMYYMKHALLSSAYQGSLEAAKFDATSASIREQVQLMLDARGIKSASISLSPNATDFAKLAKGTLFTININAPINGNVMKPHIVVPPYGIKAKVVTMK